MMKKFLIPLAVALTATPALAHTGLAHSSGLVAGLVHPILGADHLLAMLAVGLWSGFALPEKFRAGPLAFMAAMVVGAGLSWAGLGFGFAETGVLASLAVFGLLTAFARPGQAAWVSRASLIAIAAFALCHGQAHAAEATGAKALYLIGFLVSTAGLHMAGVLIARHIATRGTQRALGFGVILASLGMMAV